MNADTKTLAEAWGAAIKAKRTAIDAATKKVDPKGGYGQSDLARELGVTNVTVWRWEHGQGVPSQAMQAKLVKTLGIDKDQLYDLVTRAGAA